MSALDELKKFLHISPSVVFPEDVWQYVEKVEEEYDRLKSEYAERDRECARLWDRITRCKDCKHSHMTADGKCCKWCSIMATHQIDSNEYVDPPNGYDPEPYFDADFFCGFAERRDA